MRPKWKNGRKTTGPRDFARDPKIFRLPFFRRSHATCPRKNCVVVISNLYYLLLCQEMLCEWYFFKRVTVTSPRGVVKINKINSGDWTKNINYIGTLSDTRICICLRMSIKNSIIRDTYLHCEIFVGDQFQN